MARMSMSTLHFAKTLEGIIVTQKSPYSDFDPNHLNSTEHI